MYQIDKAGTLFINPKHIVAVEVGSQGGLVIELSSRNKPLLVRAERLNKTAPVIIAELIRETEAIDSNLYSIATQLDALQEYVKQAVNVLHDKP